MRKRLFLSLAGVAFISLGVSAWGSMTARPSASSAPTAAGPSPSPTPLASLSPLQGKQLAKEFEAALSTEVKALQHRSKFELKELKASQAARLREWEKKEKEARHKFFADHPKGSERRAFVQEFLGRRNSLLALMKEELKRRDQEASVKMQGLRSDQVARRKEFGEFLRRHEIPPNRLWPQSGQ